MWAIYNARRRRKRERERGGEREREREREREISCDLVQTSDSANFISLPQMKLSWFLLPVRYQTLSLAVYKSVK